MLQRKNTGKGHAYSLDGKKVQGVTTLISGGMPKPALPYWSAKMVAEYVADVDQSVLDALRTLGREGMVKSLKGIPWARRDAAAVRGTEVHGLAEKLSHGETVDVPDHLAGHVESCVKFFDDWRPAPVLTEVTVGSRQHTYAGTFDLVADLPDGRRSLMDYKTSASGIWGETALQLAAYRYADFFLDADQHERPMSSLEITCAHAVWITATSYEVFPVDTSAAVFELFRAVAYVARRMDGLSDLIGEAEQWAAMA